MFCKQGRVDMTDSNMLISSLYSRMFMPCH